MASAQSGEAVRAGLAGGRAMMWSQSKYWRRVAAGEPAGEVAGLWDGVADVVGDAVFDGLPWRRVGR